MWIQQDSCPDYMLKAEDCLRAEEERVNNYLHQSSKTKLLEQVRQIRPIADADLACAGEAWQRNLRLDRQGQP